MDKSTYETRLMKWAPIIKECRSSGMSVVGWCRENNVNEKKFYYWQRRIRGKAVNTVKKAELQEKAKFVKLSVPIDSSINKSAFKTDMVIHIGNNVLELSNTVSEELLSMVLKVMSNAK